MIGAIILGFFAGVIGRLLMPGDVFRHMSGPASWATSLAARPGRRVGRLADLHRAARHRRRRHLRPRRHPVGDHRRADRAADRGLRPAPHGPLARAQVPRPSRLTQSTAARVADRFPRVKLTHIGGPTALIELGGWTLLTDPTFDAARRPLQLRLGDGLGQGRRARRSRRRDLPPIDAVLLSHDHHEDNLDPAGRALLPGAGHGAHHRVGRQAARRQRPRAARVGGDTARGAGQAADRDHRHPVPPRPAAQPPDRRRRDRLHADPTRAARSGSRGDTVLYEGVRAIAGRWDIDVAILHLGGVQFPVTGPLRYTMTGARRDRARRAAQAATSRSRSTTRAGRTSSRGARRSRPSSPTAPAGRPRPLPLGADRRARRALRRLPGDRPRPERSQSACRPISCGAARCSTADQPRVRRTRRRPLAA